jgi:GT2 family glycosyltransferase
MKVEIEVVHQKSDKVFVSGWVASQNSLTKSPLSLTSLADNSEKNLILHERPDVIDALNISKEYCIGFIAVFHFEDHTDKVFEAVVGTEKQHINLSEKVFLDELVDETSLAPNHGEEIAALLTRNGFIKETVPVKTDAESVTSYFDYAIGKSRVHFDDCLLLSENTFFIFGWVIRDGFSDQSLRIQANNTISDDILTDGLFYPRPDVLKELKIPVGANDNIGVFMTVVFDKPIETEVQLIWQISPEEIHSFRLPVTNFASDEIQFTEQLLSNLVIKNSIQHPIISKNVIPALQAAWSKRLHSEHGCQIKHFGTPVNEPKLTLIIPIYGRYDFVQHQMAQFSLDTEFEQIEVIYVLDDPPLLHEFLVTCYGVFEMFRLPFTVVLSSINLGFSGANNLGFRSARAEHVLFINSDILPCAIGWAGKLLAQFKQTPNIGILGATLLYEDETVQHRGMEFCKDPSHDGIWMNYHPQKGFPLSLCDQFSIRKVPSVTGACMLMKKSDFAKVHGFDSSYILGDFEDSDLCLRVSQLGYDIYVSGDVTLYHLERLSQNIGKAKSWKATLSMINGLMHTNRWDTVISDAQEAKHD